jgi:hypothetical protein
MSHILRYSEQEVPKELLNASDTLLSELAEEARRYLGILEKLEGELSLSEREDLEAELYASVSHFKSHSEITLECLDDITDGLPEDEEVPA